MEATVVRSISTPLAVKTLARVSMNGSRFSLRKGPFTSSSKDLQ